ncbi:MAG: Phosphatidylinositol 3,5-bisphosphate-binding protein [Sarcosagium campestre]|nr:MAG: Phosphatidylinositol 3,5-bisphosphate-binding protein [Sarcosagium campestre]
MLGRANYIALVGGGKQPKFPQNKLVLWDDAKQKAIITLEFRSLVRRVRLSRTRIVVALHNSIHVYAFSSPPHCLAAYETADNPLGLCCLGQRILVFPGRTPGQVQLVEIESGNVSIVPAHTSPLRALELSPDGEIVATASHNGTLIRIFSTRNCARIAELRRGVDQAAIFSLAISPSSTLLAVTSDKSTLHIFDLPYLHHQSTDAGGSGAATANSTASGSEEGSSQKWGMLGKIPMMPRVFSDVYSFTSAHFEIGDEPSRSTGRANSPSLAGFTTDLPGGQPSKGIIGWLSDERLVVIGSGHDGRWERFVVGQAKDGRRYCVRDGWKRYLGGV